ncbi:latent-transforming growth factor beta-binding protein 4 isoform X2 [Pelobates fuscus]|uniref:latent-transforming growth factor beta-binding protein 4 isoform X2 n=1 Tax=Pelobates fuscus TaxID=191477 RepID=UPI002FE475A6
MERRLILISLSFCCLGWMPASGQVEKVRVMFTPMICRVRCLGDRCTNQCDRGNMTTVYSDDIARTNDQNGFRAFLCPLLCQNGGVCLKKDQCLCPPNFTGKFCQIPISSGAPIASLVQVNSSGEQNTKTKSVYTLPLSNHKPEKDGVASLVNVLVEHPPEASVNIHQVERVDGRGERKDGGRQDISQNTVHQAGRVPLYRIQAQSSPRINGYTENSGYGYCFRRLENGQCASPFPGLRTQEVCCKGNGVAWGVLDCTPCAGYQGDALLGALPDSPCPKGFEKLNGTCVDIDECKDPSLCQNGDCTNTRGSFSCVCRPGYLLDSSWSSCISDHVISEAKGPCFRILRDGGCSHPILKNITKQICCCSRVGKAWGRGCERCPPFGTDGFKETCPAGPGYHYSASDLRINARYVGQDQARVPVIRQPGVRRPTFTTPATARQLPHAETRVNVPEGRQDRNQGVSTDHTGSTQVQGEINPPVQIPRQTETRVEAPPQETNLCELNPQICGPGRCVPRSGSYACVCNNGYRISTQGTHCIDVDECRQRQSPCANGRCENTIGSYRCACSTGFRTNPQGTECTDIDECSSEQQLCSSGQCQNTPGSYRCLCSSGFTLSPQGTNCIDIDECRLTTRRLCQNGRCENTPGSFLCVCPAGFAVNTQGTDCQDIDECRQTPRLCGSGRCQNTPGSYRCSCLLGYRMTPQGSDCIDINECENPAVCIGQECVNTLGSFECRPCLPGYKLQNRRCVDQDECIQSVCGPIGKCINTAGSFICECFPGFQLDSRRTNCTDINECLEGEYCFPHGECQNTEGSYTCVCAEGYVLSPGGTSCIDQDECQLGTLCQGGRCSNTQGSFQCVCPRGFRATANKATCADIDECQEREASICGTQKCENTLGSYRCISECDSGYRRTASNDCADINECSNATICGDNAKCENVIGSYRCTCNLGYEKSIEGHCVDIDECLEYGNSICGASHCENTPGHFKCVTDCLTGYQLSPSGECTDINECLTLQGVCGRALCQNTDGSFFCICPNTNEEFDPMSGKCLRTGDPVFSQRPSSPRILPSGPLSGQNECYYNLEDPNVCQNVLARNVTHSECCCSVGKGWGRNCQFQRCPEVDSVEYQELCPEGVGYIATGQGYKDIDECEVFRNQVCKDGICVNKVPLFACYCANGYYYDLHRMECVDNDECQKEEACEGAQCVNTVGSYHCTCSPPLVLDASQRRCVSNSSQSIESNLALCWQEVGANLICSRPLLDRQTTYTECCCLYGDAWGMDCAFCPARDSDDFESLCSIFRSPGFGNPASLPSDPYSEYGPEYGPPYGIPYGPDAYANPPSRIVRPGYDAYPSAPGGGLEYGSRSSSSYDPRDSSYSLPPFESPDFESDLSYPDPAIDDLRPPYRRSDVVYDSRRGPSSPISRPRRPVNTPGQGSDDGRQSQPWRPGSRDTESLAPQSNWRGGLREAYEDRYEQFEGLQAEECGIVNGCENGRCIRVPEGYTCDCYDGYRLDITRMACIDINECDEADDMSLLCLNGQCRNTDGSYECVCPRGFVLSRQHNYCVPSQH